MTLNIALNLTNADVNRIMQALFSMSATPTEKLENEALQNKILEQIGMNVNPSRVHNGRIRL